MNDRHETTGTYEVMLASTCLEKRELRALFQEVATEQGWQSGDWLHDDPPGAIYLGLKSGAEWLGGLQMVLPNASTRLPYSAVWPEVVLPSPMHTGHIAVLAFRPEFRGKQGYFWALCVELWRLCLKADIRAVVLEATPPMLVRYQKLGWPLEVIGEARMHWGEPCLLAYMEFDRVALSMLKQALRSPSYRTLVTRAVRSSRDIPCLTPSALS